MSVYNWRDFQKKQLEVWKNNPKIQWQLIGEFRSISGINITARIIKFVVEMPCTHAILLPKTMQQYFKEELKDVKLNLPSIVLLYKKFKQEIKEDRPPHERLLMALPSDIRIAFLPSYVCSTIRTHQIWARIDQITGCP